MNKFEQLNLIDQNIKAALNFLKEAEKDATGFASIKKWLEKSEIEALKALGATRIERQSKVVNLDKNPENANWLHYHGEDS